MPNHRCLRNPTDSVHFRLQAPPIAAVLVALVLATLIGCRTPPAPDPVPVASAIDTRPTFWSHWGDRKTEVNIFQTQSRRGETQLRGESVQFWRPEGFSNRTQNSMDAPNNLAGDLAFVMRVYRIDTLFTPTGPEQRSTLVISHIGADFTPAKISFTASSVEGHVWQQVIFGESRVESLDVDRLVPIPARERSQAEDNIPVLVRQLLVPKVPPGESVSHESIPRLSDQRLAGEEFTFRNVHLRRGKIEQRKTVRVPAGEFLVEVWLVDSGSQKGEILTELEYPHRIISWSFKDGESGELLASERLLLEGNAKADEKILIPFLRNAHAPKKTEPEDR